VFGESVLNDAIAINLFKTFFQFYNPETSNDDTSVATVIASFLFVSGCSILVGVALGLCASFLFKHTELDQYPKLETSLVLCFCYLCYATAESVSLSGIISLFFNGITLSHYNAYNLSIVAEFSKLGYCIFCNRWRSLFNRQGCQRFPVNYDCKFMSK
jgi:NhaP-type Na+/H+ or K+/H+ antiporter